VLTHPEEDKGGTVRATAVSAEVGTDTAMLQASQEQHTTVEPGLRWRKPPAALAPVWREKPERLAACAMRTVVGVRGYRLIQRQGRLDLRTHDQQLPGNTGLTAPPTAAVVLALLTQVARVHIGIEAHEGTQLSGGHPHHLLVWDALGLDASGYAVPSAQKHSRGIETP